MHDQLQSSGSTLPHGRTLQHGDPVPNGNPADGITKFRVLVQTDPATGRFDTLLSAGADPADTDGLFHLGWLPGETRPSKNLGLTMLGSYLSFWPLLAAAPPVDAVQHLAEGRDGAVVDAALAGAALTVPAVVAALPWFTIERVILYGAEYFQRNRRRGGVRGQPPVRRRHRLVAQPARPRDHREGAPALGPLQGDRAALREPRRRRDPAVRPQAGLRQLARLHDRRRERRRPPHRRPARPDPPRPRGAAVAQQPADLRDRHRARRRPRRRVRRPGQRAGLPRCAATARADRARRQRRHPGALVGSGYMQIGSATDSGGHTISTIGGQIDLTLRPISLRVAAAVEIATIPAEAGGPATGVYVGLNVVLPVGIPLGTLGPGHLRVPRDLRHALRAQPRDRRQQRRARARVAQGRGRQAAPAHQPGAPRRQALGAQDRPLGLRSRHAHRDDGGRGDPEPRRHPPARAARPAPADHDERPDHVAAAEHGRARSDRRHPGRHRDHARSTSSSGSS